MNFVKFAEFWIKVQNSPHFSFLVHRSANLILVFLWRVRALRMGGSWWLAVIGRHCHPRHPRHPLLGGGGWSGFEGRGCRLYAVGYMIAIKLCIGVGEQTGGYDVAMWFIWCSKIISSFLMKNVRVGKTFECSHLNTKKIMARWILLLAIRINFQRYKLSTNFC